MKTSKAQMLALVEEFKSFVLDTMEEGFQEDFPGDELEFLAACLETYTEFKKEE